MAFFISSLEGSLNAKPLMKHNTHPQYKHHPAPDGHTHPNRYLGRSGWSTRAGSLAPPPLLLHLLVGPEERAIPQGPAARGRGKPYAPEHNTEEWTSPQRNPKQ